jgi:chromosomal replication initiator protein
VPSALNPRYTFPEFVIGKCNEAAYSAASAAAVAPGKLYNPILITGGTGLGKTHLAHAVAAEAQLRPDRSVLLVSADEFLRRISTAAGMGTFTEAIQEMAAVKMLIIDDVHVLDRHPTAQEALATLASLAAGNSSQLMLTSDTASGADTLSVRLVCRFRAAHIANLGVPDWDHRVAILHAKAKALDVELPPSVAHHIAAQSEGSVRELEGLLTRVLAVASLENAPLTMSLALRAVPTKHREQGDIVGPHLVQEAIAAEWGVAPDALTGSGRARALSQPRRLAMLLCRDVLDLSLREIGAAFGDRDVSTVLAAITRARTELSEEATVSARVERVRSVLPAAQQ